MQRSPYNNDIFGELYRELKRLNDLIVARTNQQTPTLPQYNHLSLPQDMQENQVFIDSITFKFYIYVNGAAILVGP